MSEACGANKKLASFKFVFILHLVHKIMRITDVLFQTLQRRSQDIIADMSFVSTTKQLLQELKEYGWEEFFEEVKFFCSKHVIKIPNLDNLYNTGRTSDDTTIEHYYHFDVFNEALDFVVVELNTGFSDTSVELLSLSAALDPKDSFRSFNSRDICTLAEKFYREDFSKQDIITLEYKLQHYERDVTCDPLFHVSTLAQLCRKLFASRRSETYSMVTRLICLVLTLLVFAVSSKLAFSTIKHVKKVVCNKMEDDFHADSIMLNIERELVVKLYLNSIVDEYGDSKPRREKLK